MKAKLYLLIALIALFSTKLNAQYIRDSLFQQADFVVAGKITQLFGGFMYDLGTEAFSVTIVLDTIYKQNSHLNTPELTINWQVSNLRCLKPELQDCVDPYVGKKWIFLLNRKHINGGGDELDSFHICPFTIENHSKTIQLAEKEKIRIDPYAKKTVCSNDCSFCNHIDNEEWDDVRHDIAQLASKVRIDEWLKNHRNVQYVLPMGDVLASLPTNGNLTVGFTSQNKLNIKSFGFQIGNVHNPSRLVWISDPDHIILKSFEDGQEVEKKLLSAIRDSLIYEHRDSLKFPDSPPIWVPDLEFIRLWYALEENKYYWNDGSILPEFSKRYIDSLEKDSMLYSLCLLNLHSNTDFRIWAIKALNRLNDARCIPYLLELADFYSAIWVIGSENATIYQIYLSELVKTLDHLTGCNTVYLYGSPYEQNRLSINLPIWKGKLRIVNY